MACRIIWSQTAVDDLRQIVEFIAIDDAAAAASLADRILNRIERAAELPFSDRAVPESAKRHPYPQNLARRPRHTGPRIVFNVVDSYELS
jgi:plasmid stabilization system protein ParE